MKILWPSNQSSILLAKNLSFLGVLELVENRDRPRNPDHGHLVSAPQSPECRRSQTTTPRVTHNCQVVDVDPIVERINPIANLPCVLAIDLDAGVILGPGESETAATGFLPLRHQTDTRGTLHQDFGLALMKKVPYRLKNVHLSFPV